MKLNKPHSLKMRGIILTVFCLLTLVWNMALSSRRKYFSGKLTPVSQEDLVLKVSCPGKIQPKVEQTLSAQLDGTKKAVYVREGEEVKEGQLLMEISDDKLRSEILQRQGTLKNTQADFLKTQKDYDLEKKLFKQMAVPRRDVDNAKQALDRAVQAVVTAREDLKLTEKKLTGVKITSPLDGIVIKNFVENESWISTGKDLMKVAKLDHFIVRGHVDELDIAQVSVGQEVSVTCDAFPGQEMKGAVSWIGAQAGDGAFAEIEITIDLTDTKGLSLKPNLSCEAAIKTGEIPKALVVPAQGIRHGAQGAYVLKAERGGWLKKQPVVVGRTNTGRAVVTKGLEQGDSILVPEAN